MTILHRLSQNVSGAIAPIAAILALVVIGCCALAVDIGSFYLARQSLQGAADLAAIAAADALVPSASVADNLATTRSAAVSALQANGYNASTLVGLDLGTYSPDSTLPPGQRFAVTNAAGANGVRLTVGTVTPMFLGKVFFDPTSRDPISGQVKVNVTASAARARFASFGIDSTVATLDGGIANAVLTSLLGGTVNLSLVSYNGLVNSQIDLFAFAKALATQISFTGPNYNSLFNTNVKVADVLTALANSNGGTTSESVAASNALTQLSQVNPSATINLSRLIDFGPFGQMSVGGAAPINLRVSVSSLLYEVLSIANGMRVVSSDLSANVPSLVSLKSYLAVGERPVGEPWVAISPEGAKVHTAQTRLLLVATVQPTSQLKATVPIYTELAAGTATLQSIACGPVSVGVTAKAGLVSSWIGNVTPDLMQNTTSISNPGPAPVISLENVGTVTASANAAITSASPTPLTFSQTDIANNTPQTVHSQDFTSSLITSLLSTLQIGFNGTGAMPTGLGPALSSSLTKATNPLDSVINSVLTVAGASLGVAQVHVSDVRCDGAVLVQ